MLSDNLAEKVAPIFFQVFNSFIGEQNRRHLLMGLEIAKLKLDRSKLMARSADATMRAAMLFGTYSKLPSEIKKDVVSHQLLRATTVSNAEEVIWYLSSAAPDAVPEKTALLVEGGSITKRLGELEAEIGPAANRFNSEFGEIVWPSLRQIMPIRKTITQQISLVPSKNPLRRLPIVMAFGGFCGLILGTIGAAVVDYRKDEKLQLEAS